MRLPPKGLNIQSRGVAPLAFSKACLLTRLRISRSYSSASLPCTTDRIAVLSESSWTS